MKKKPLFLTIAAGTVGVALAAAKLIANRKVKKDDFELPERNDIFDLFYDAYYDKKCGDLGDEEYRKTLSAIRDKATKRGKIAVNKLLDEAYDEAWDAALQHTFLMHDVKDTKSASLEDFIKRFPHRAFNNDVLGLNPYCYESQAKDSADYLAKEYYKKLREKEDYLFEYVEMLGGDTNEIKEAFDKTRDL